MNTTQLLILMVLAISGFFIFATAPNVPVALIFGVVFFTVMFVFRTSKSANRE